MSAIKAIKIYFAKDFTSTVTSLDSNRSGVQTTHQDCIEKKSLTLYNRYQLHYSWLGDSNRKTLRTAFNDHHIKRTICFKEIFILTKEKYFINTFHISAIILIFHKVTTSEKNTDILKTFYIILIYIF